MAGTMKKKKKLMKVKKIRDEAKNNLYLKNKKSYNLYFRRSKYWLNKNYIQDIKILFKKFDNCMIALDFNFFGG